MSVAFIRNALETFGLWLVIAATLYVCLAGRAAVLGRIRERIGRSQSLSRRSLRRRRVQPVTVLKPLCGSELALYENLKSFCEQAHPHFQLLFGLHDPADPAGAVVRRLQAEYPSVDIELVVDSRIHGANLKVSNLANLLSHARHEWLVLADSDIRVPSDYLDRVTAPLADPGVGVVTCLYRGIPRSGAWSRIGAQFIDEWFAPSVEVAYQFGSTRFSFGATIALRRQTLNRVGGFHAIRNMLADDFWLGELTRRLGLRTVLSDVVIATDVTEANLPSVWTHELRWMQTVRSVSPLGFAFVFVTFTFPVLVAGALMARTPLCLYLAAFGAGARYFLHFMQKGRKSGRAVVFDALAVPVRDCILMSEWTVALCKSWTQWRSQNFYLWTERRGRA